MADLSYVAQLVRAKIRGPSEPAIRLAIIESARQFCTESWFVRRTVIADLVPDTETYQLLLDGSTDLEIIGVRAADVQALDGGEIRPLVDEDFSGVEPGRTARQPTVYQFVPYGFIAVRPVPTEAGLMRVEVACTVADDAQTLPDDLITEYARALSQGALAALQTQAGTDWFNPNMAASNQAMYSAAVTNAKGRSLRNFNRRNLRARPARFIV
ncbi:MAG: hypothetical protein C0434_08050 [Xanthomonadaceae bacterium]|nr:hypothetical protein [Xanthomonadaceae bacterium]